MGTLVRRALESGDRPFLARNGLSPKTIDLSVRKSGAGSIVVALPGKYLLAIVTDENPAYDRLLSLPERVPGEYVLSGNVHELAVGGVCLTHWAYRKFKSE